MPVPIRVLIGDDHAIVREGLRSVLAGEEFVVVGDAVNGEAVLQEVGRTHPDVVLMDLVMPVMDGREAARRVLAEYPGVRVLMLSTFGDEQNVVACLKMGVHGYLLKDVETTELKKSIRAVMRGEAVIDPKVAGLLVAKVRGDAPSSQPREGVSLTHQQLAILRLVAQGHSNREIGSILNLSENTVKGHVAEILNRLGVRNRVEAAMQASARGWL